MLLQSSGTGPSSVTGFWYRTVIVWAGWSLTFLHYPSRWLGTAGKAEQTASCHSADIASPFAATGGCDEDEEEDK